MKFDLRIIYDRINVFVDYFIANITSDPDRNLRSLHSKCQTFIDAEEKLFLILLTTHFDSVHLAIDFHHKCNWNEIQQASEEYIWKICKEYILGREFTGNNLIGDHRRYFRCLPKDKKVEYSAKILVSYKQVIERYGSQVAFFEIGNKKVVFDVLYKKMKKIANFHPRLPRFDHLERLSRLHQFYVVPDRFYAEDSTGPLYGVICILFGARLSKDSGVTRRYLVKTFPYIWNEQIGGKFAIPDNSDFEQVMKSVEHWVVNQVRNWESLPSKRRYDKAFIFDIESCLCNWQKGKCLDGFR